MSRSVTLVVLHLVYYLLLLFAYHVCVLPLYEDYGFDADFDLRKAIAALVCIASLSFMIAPNSRSSEFLLRVILITGPTPALVLVAGANLPIEFGMMVVLGFILVTKVAQFPWQFTLPTPRISASTTQAILTSIAVVGVVALALAGGTRYLNFDIYRVYEFRRDAAAAVPDIFKYIIPNLSFAVIPLAMALAIRAQRFGLAVLLMGCSLMLAALSNHKGPAFYPLFIVATMWTTSRSKPELWLLLCLITAVFFACAESLFSIAADGEMGMVVSDLLIRRVLMGPALLDYYHWQFFMDNASLLWAESRFGFGLFENPHGMTSPKLIANEYFGRAEMSANTGYVGSGFAQAKYFGVILYACVLGLLLAYVDRVSQRLGKSVATAAFIVTVSNAATGTDTTNLPLTGGLVVLVIFASLTAPLRCDYSKRIKFSFLSLDGYKKD